MDEDYILIKITDLPVAQGPDGLVVYGVNVLTNESVQIPYSLFQIVAYQALATAKAALEAVQISEIDYPELTI